MNCPAHRARTLLPLLLADAFFLWMFLAADPLEQMADAGQILSDDVTVGATARRFAADWRHGMAGNSLVYMPGFFALAAAGWFWAGSRSTRRLFVEGGAILIVALGLAGLAAPLGARWVVEAFQRDFGLHVRGPSPAATWQAALAGMYTALTWTVFVVTSRQAISRRSVWPLTPVPVLGVILALVRPWTVGDFSSLWIERATSGDAVAVWSVIAVPALASLLVTEQLSPHLIQTALSRLRTNSEK